MQVQVGQLHEELKEAKEQLTTVEAEKERLLDELGEMKKVAEEANLRLCEALMAQTGPHQSSDIEMSLADELKRASNELAQKDQAWRLELEAVKMQHAMNVDALSSALQELDWVHRELRVALEAKDAAVKMTEDTKNVADANARRVLELSAELESMTEALANSREELEIKQINVQALTIELEKAKYIAVELEEKEESLTKLKQELTYTKESESELMDELSEAKMKLQMLEDEMEKAKQSESKMFSLLALQTNQLEQTKILLEESRLEATCFNEKVEYLERSAEQSCTEHALSHSCSMEKEEPDSQSIEETVVALKSELQVVKECLAHSQEGEKLAQSEAQAVAQELNCLRTELNLALDAEEKSRKAMDDLALALREVSTEANDAKGKLISSQSETEKAMREVERLKEKMKSTEEKYVGLLNEAERLRLEAEESNLAWKRKEEGFINCINRTEEEFHDTKQENDRLLESMREAEYMSKASKEETSKLRDILKQALNEANVAKEAAEIARAENYQLKDCLAEIDITLQNLTQENEGLRISEATALESIEDSKRQLSIATKTGTAPKPPTTDLRAEYKEQEGEALRRNLPTCEENKDGKKLDEGLSVGIQNLIDTNGYKEADDNPRMDKTLKTSSVCSDDAETEVSKEETTKLQDTLKQALNEADVAKEAAEIAKAENYQLKDCLAEMGITLQNLTQENEGLRIKEATALENLKDLKRQLSIATTTVTAPKPPNCEEKKDSRTSSVCSDDAETFNSEDSDHKDGKQVHNIDHDKNKHKKKRALLKRFGDHLKNNLPTIPHRRWSSMS